MKTDNAKTIMKHRLLSGVLSFIFIVTVALLYLYNSEYINNAQKNYIVFVLGSVYVLYNIFLLILNRTYINYSDEKEKIEFKYFSSLPFASKNRYIAIPKNIFAGYTIKNHFFGLKPKLLLKQKSSRGGVATYPPVCLSALSKSEISQLCKSLDQYTQKA